ncbi:hypothetical protein PG994_014305 [Apiospora phragmitis]|uniref:LITAF domain-containing protein n=1 Tax=Apiospora phragmitis TaxID=2905665 RepID=A0ABR1T6B6_9PEZI
MSTKEAQNAYARDDQASEFPARSPVEAPAVAPGRADAVVAASHHTCQCQTTAACYTVCCHGVRHLAGHHSYHEPVTANVVPVPLLQRWSALAQCPGCHEVAPTVVKYKSGKGTHWMATFFFFTTGIFTFIPYAVNHFKNAEHSCVHCGRLLATYRFGSGPRAHVL